VLIVDLYNTTAADLTKKCRAEQVASASPLHMLRRVGS
jgi:hypothetical protein